MKYQWLVVFLLLTSFSVFAQVPRKISYQGVLTNSSGSPAQDGNYTLQFRLYDVSSGGSALYTETHNPVSVQRGSFKVLLGSVTPITLPFDIPYYLEMTVTAGPDVSSPVTFDRSPFSSMPYALRSDTAQYAKAGGTLTLPFIDTTVNTNSLAFGIQNNGLGTVATFYSNNQDGNLPALIGKTRGSGPGVQGIADGNGSAGEFQILNEANNNAALYAATSGTGNAVFGNNSGTGSGGYFSIDNSSNTHAAVKGYQPYNGPGVEGISGGNSPGVKGTSNSYYGVAGFSTNGTGVYGDNGNSNTIGHAGFFSGRTRVTQDLLVDRNLGVGTATPGAKMEINYNSTMTDPQALLYENDNDFARLSFKNNQTTEYWSIAGYLSATSANSRLNFYSSQTGNDVLSLAGNGNIGIGTSSPTARLEVVDNANDANLRVTSSATYGAQFELKPTEAASKRWWLTSVGSAGGSRQGNLEFTQLNDLITPLTLTKLGSVGIGTTNPASTLHISDAVSPSSFTLGVSSTAGGYTSLLTSLSAVSNGYASLQAVQSAGASYGKLILNKDGGNVGIGKTNPGYALDVNGTINATNILKNGISISSNYNNTVFLKKDYGSGYVVPSTSALLSDLQYTFTLTDSAIVMFTFAIDASYQSCACAGTVALLQISYDGSPSVTEGTYINTLPPSILTTNRTFIQQFGAGTHSIDPYARFFSGYPLVIKHAELIIQIIPK